MRQWPTKKIQTQQMGVRNQIEFEAFQHEMESLKERADTLEESGLMRKSKTSPSVGSGSLSLTSEPEPSMARL